MIIDIWPIHDAVQLDSSKLVRTDRSILGDIVDAVVDPVLSGVLTVINFVIKNIVDTLLSFVNQLFPGISLIFTFISEMFEEFFQTALNVATIYLIRFSETLDNLVLSIVTIVSDLITNILKIISRILDVFDTIITMIRNIVDKAADDANMIFNRVLTEIKSATSSVLTSTGCGTTANVKDITYRMTASVTTIINLIEEMPKAIHRLQVNRDIYAMTLYNTARNNIQKLYKDLVTSMSYIIDDVEAIVNDIVITTNTVTVEYHRSVQDINKYALQIVNDGETKLSNIKAYAESIDINNKLKNIIVYGTVAGFSVIGLVA